MNIVFFYLSNNNKYNPKKDDNKKISFKFKILNNNT